MQTEPIYKSVPTMRDYEEYKKAKQYTLNGEANYCLNCGAKMESEE